MFPVRLALKDRKVLRRGEGFDKIVFAISLGAVPYLCEELMAEKREWREMVENMYTFADYIRSYDLQKAEGVLLRHLMSVYKVLDHTVPSAAKNEALHETELFLKTMIRQVDSSLLDEWEKMRDPNYAAQVVDEKELRPPGAEEAARDITRDAKAFTAAIR